MDTSLLSDLNRYHSVYKTDALPIVAKQARKCLQMYDTPCSNKSKIWPINRQFIRRGDDKSEICKARGGAVINRRFITDIFINTYLYMVTCRFFTSSIKPVIGIIYLF